MDLKKEVRRRIAELTRLAYERGYRDGAQSVLAEIESAAGQGSTFRALLPRGQRAG